MYFVYIPLYTATASLHSPIRVNFHTFLLFFIAIFNGFLTFSYQFNCALSHLFPLFRHQIGRRTFVTSHKKHPYFSVASTKRKPCFDTKKRLCIDNIGIILYNDTIHVLWIIVDKSAVWLCC